VLIQFDVTEETAERFGFSYRAPTRKLRQSRQARAPMTAMPWISISIPGRAKFATDQRAARIAAVREFLFAELR